MFNFTEPKNAEIPASFCRHHLVSDKMYKRINLLCKIKFLMLSQNLQSAKNLIK